MEDAASLCGKREALQEERLRLQQQLEQEEAAAVAAKAAGGTGSAPAAAQQQQQQQDEQQDSLDAFMTGGWGGCMGGALIRACVRCSREGCR